MSTQGCYTAEVRHDHGKVYISTFAQDAGAAKRAIMAAERCPERSILSIERRAPNDQLQPEDAEWMVTSGWDIVDDPDDDDCYAVSARHWVEDFGGFDSKTEAVEFLRKERA